MKPTPLSRSPVVDVTSDPLKVQLDDLPSSVEGLSDSIRKVKVSFRGFV